MIFKQYGFEFKMMALYAGTILAVCAGAAGLALFLEWVAPGIH